MPKAQLSNRLLRGSDVRNTRRIHMKLYFHPKINTATDGKAIELSPCTMQTPLSISTKFNDSYS